MNRVCIKGNKGEDKIKTQEMDFFIFQHLVKIKKQDPLRKTKTKIFAHSSIHKISIDSIFIKPYEHKKFAIWIMPPFFKNKNERRKIIWRKIRKMQNIILHVIHQIMSKILKVDDHMKDHAKSSLPPPHEPTENSSLKLI
jgi:hypothetical protein